MVIKKQLSHFLKLKRIESGLTQSELGELLGDIHPQFISNWERGLCAPPSHSLQKLISILKIKRMDLLEIMVADSRREIKIKIYSKEKWDSKKST